MSRPKGALNKKTIRNLENLAPAEQKQDVVKEDKQVELMQKKIEELNKKIEQFDKLLAQKDDPSKIHQIESRVKLENINKTYIMPEKEKAGWEEKKREAILELNNERTQLGAFLGGRQKVFEYSTSPDDSELRKRIVASNRALAFNTAPKISDIEKNKLLKRYKELTEKLKPLVASQKDAWDVSGPHYQEAIEKAVALNTTHKKLVTEWINIGKIMDPSNSSLWSLEALEKK